MWKSGGSFWSTWPTHALHKRPDAEVIGQFGSAERHVAILDARAIIVDINSEWRRFAQSNGMMAEDCGIGLNYLEICDRAGHENSAQRAATSIRAVMEGSIDRASFIYPCNGPAERRSFVFETYRYNAQFLVVCHIHLRQLGRLGII